MKSVMTNRFAINPSVDIPRSTFDRSHGYKTTFNADYLYPVYWDEVLPGDTFEVRMNGFARMNTPMHPLMDNLYLETFFFEVPSRLIWENWRKFMGERYPDPDSSIDFTVPQAVSTADSATVSKLSDYIGLPVNVVGLSYSNFVHRAYNLIWNEWFRDENLQDSVTVDTGDGPDDPANYVLLKANKKHDYFTSALPWPQKGDAVSLPLGTTAPVQSDGNSVYVNAPGFNSTLQMHNNSNAVRLGAGNFTGASQDFLWGQTTDPADTGLEVDLSSATAATINQLREAFQIQKLLERDARGGTRYIEIIRSHFGVTSPDGRAWRPVYLGGGRSRVNITPVPQTGATDAAVSPQGNLAAYATVAMADHACTKSFTEHGYIIGLMCVRADLTYQQGLNRMLSRSTRYDYYWPALSQIGEQAVLNKEIYAQGTANPTEDEGVFGYQERYAEYRYYPSMVTGKMRSVIGAPLDTWHLSEEFGALPTLASTFIESNTPMDRVMAVPSEPDFTFDSYLDIKCHRPMPLYGIPGNLDRF